VKARGLLFTGTSSGINLFYNISLIFSPAFKADPATVGFNLAHKFLK